MTVPKGRLWVMGDNRAQSDDSRYHYVNDYKNDPVLSTVPKGDVIGKAVIIAWPPSRWRTLGTPSTFTSAGATALPAVASAAALVPCGGCGGGAAGGNPTPGPDAPRQPGPGRGPVHAESARA